MTKIFIPTAELPIPIGITTKEAKAEMETHPIRTEAKISKCLMQFKILETFLCFLLINFS